MTQNIQLIDRIDKHCSERRQEVMALLSLLTDSVTFAHHNQEHELVEIYIPNSEVVSDLRNLVRDFVQTRLISIERELTISHDAILGRIKDATRFETNCNSECPPTCPGH